MLTSRRPSLHDSAPGSPPRTSSLPNRQTPAYELVRSLELEDELEEGPTLADLAGACSPATRVGLGALRLFVAAMASLISALYIMWGVLYDTEETRWLGAMVFGAVDAPGLLFAANYSRRSRRHHLRWYVGLP